MRLACMPCLTTTNRLGAGPARRSMGRLRDTNVRPSVLMLQARRRLATKLHGGITLFYGMSRGTMMRDVSTPAVCRMPLLVRTRKLSRAVLGGVNLPIKRAPKLNP